jgi:hypothetical protein
MVRPRSIVSIVSATAVSIVAAIAIAIPAGAVTLEDKLSVLSRFSQPTAAGFSDWQAAHANQGEWAEYGFDWSTDLCSASPDQPLGFDFRMPCTRHDFGYRNYKAVGQFDANKGRVDDAFYFDMKQVCSEYSGIPKSTCNGLAWTYYEAVKNFGSVLVSEKKIKQVEKTTVVDARRADD